MHQPWLLKWRCLQTRLRSAAPARLRHGLQLQNSRLKTQQLAQVNSYTVIEVIEGMVAGYGL